MEGKFYEYIKGKEVQEDENKGKGNQCRKNRRGKEKITKKRERRREGKIK